MKVPKSLNAKKLNAKYESFLLMDGRAVTDVDRASVLCACEDLEDAFEGITDYGDDTCVVGVQTVGKNTSWVLIAQFNGTGVDVSGERKL